MFKISDSIILCILASVSISEGLLCYECNNARNDDACRRTGHITLCGENQKSCQTTERIDYAFGNIVTITKRCKQARACANNYRQNNFKKQPQCKYFKDLSVCRCCCTSDMCNFDNSTCAGVAEKKYLREYTRNCPRLPRLKRGFKVCDNKNFPGSRCHFRCNKFYDLRGPGFVQCHADKHQASWSGKMPCCSKPCPPHGNMDLVFCVDSSLEMEEDFEKVKQLVKNLIRSFIIGPQDSRIGIVTYNEKIGIADEIFLSSFNTSESLAEAVNFLPHNPGPSKGTRIGQMLDHINRVSLTTERGNRRNVRDILVILTSGPPLKEKLEPELMAKGMRDNGIEVITVGVGRYVDMKELRGTAGIKKRVVEIPGGIEKIGESRFKDQILRAICGSSCTKI